MPLITKREDNFSQWYQDTIQFAGLAENSPVRGCMIIRPLGMRLWEGIKTILDRLIQAKGHENVYFPMLVPLSFFEREAEHIEGFSKECAVVTHHRLEKTDGAKLIPSPSAQLEEPFVIRPTSETLIGEAMARWIQSYRDLPLKINQWCNVMRWELRPRLLLRTSEFLWQEGHTAHASCEDAKQHTLDMLNMYEAFLEEYLAISVIKGFKTPSETFPGADITYTVEARMQNGKALQAGTSHFLGQNFSRAYHITFTDSQQTQQTAWTTSWGVTTRLIGALVMVHGDDDGFVAPPRIAPIQVMILPLSSGEGTQDGLNFCNKIKSALEKIPLWEDKIRVKVDLRDKKPVDKYWQAVREGVPLRVEIGAREIENQTVSFARRDEPSTKKSTISLAEFLEKAPKILLSIQESLLKKSKESLNSNIQTVVNLEELRSLFGENRSKKFAYGFFDSTHEDQPLIAQTLKDLKISARCIPIQDSPQETGVCIFTGNAMSHRVILAPAY